MVVVVVDSATEDGAEVGLVVVVVINRNIDNDGDDNFSADVLCEKGDIMGVNKTFGLGAVSIVVLVDLDVVPGNRRLTTSRRIPRPAAAADDTSS